MRLIAISDIHGAYERVMSTLTSAWPWDGLIMAGDLTTLGSEQEAGEAVDMLLSFGVPVAGVCGNMDPMRLERVFESKGISVNGTGMTWGSVGIFGVSGSPPTPMHTPYEMQETDIAETALRGWKLVETTTTKIFVPHAPPQRTTLDLIGSGHHVGSTAVRSFIEKRKPNVTVCGHIHESRGVDSIGPTTIVNCGPAGSGSYAILDIGESVKVELRG